MPRNADAGRCHKTFTQSNIACRNTLFGPRFFHFTLLSGADRSSSSNLTIMFIQGVNNVYGCPFIPPHILFPHTVIIQKRLVLINQLATKLSCILSNLSGSGHT